MLITIPSYLDGSEKVLIIFFYVNHLTNNRTKTKFLIILPFVFDWFGYFTLCVQSITVRLYFNLTIGFISCLANFLIFNIWSIVELKSSHNLNIYADNLRQYSVNFFSVYILLKNIDASASTKIIFITNHFCIYTRYPQYTYILGSIKSQK